MLLSLLTALNAAWAAAPLFHPRDPGFLCNHPDTVVIATVEDKTSFYASTGFIHSDIKLNIERSVKGTLSQGDTFLLTIGGGTIGKTTSSDSWSPNMPKGSRYALFITTVGLQDPVISSYQRLDENADLPSEQTLQNEMANQCRGH